MGTCVRLRAFICVNGWQPPAHKRGPVGVWLTLRDLIIHALLAEVTHSVAHCPIFTLLLEILIRVAEPSVSGTRVVPLSSDSNLTG